MTESLYKETNNVGTMMKYSKGTTSLSSTTKQNNTGTCAALSSIFLKNWFSKDPAKTKPDPVLAQIIFARSWMKPENVDVDKFNHAAIKGARLKGTGLFPTEAGVGGILKYMSENPAKYYVDLQQGHICAAVTDGGFYFYDSNGLGLSKYASADEFKTQVKSHLTSEGWSDATTPWIYSVEDA